MPKFRIKCEVIEAMEFVVNSEKGWPLGVCKDGESPTGYSLEKPDGSYRPVAEGDFVFLRDGRGYAILPGDIFRDRYEPAAGEPVDIGIRVQEDPPEQSNGIRFMTIVRIDRNLFQAARPKDARLMVRRQFQFALPPLMKVVDEEHVKLNPPEVPAGG